MRQSTSLIRNLCGAPGLVGFYFKPSGASAAWVYSPSFAPATPSAITEVKYWTSDKIFLIKKRRQNQTSGTAWHVAVTSWPSPVGGQWCPATPFHVWPPSCCIHPIFYLKMWSPLVFFALPPFCKLLATGLCNMSWYCKGLEMFSPFYTFKQSCDCCFEKRDKRMWNFHWTDHLVSLNSWNNVVF